MLMHKKLVLLMAIMCGNNLIHSMEAIKNILISSIKETGHCAAFVGGSLALAPLFGMVYEMGMHHTYPKYFTTEFNDDADDGVSQKINDAASCELKFWKKIAALWWVGSSFSMPPLILACRSGSWPQLSAYDLMIPTGAMAGWMSLALIITPLCDKKEKKKEMNKKEMHESILNCGMGLSLLLTAYALAQRYRMS